MYVVGDNLAIAGRIVVLRHHWSEHRRLAAVYVVDAATVRNVSIPVSTRVIPCQMNETMFSMDRSQIFLKFGTVVELVKKLTYTNFYFRRASGFQDMAVRELKK